METFTWTEGFQKVGEGVYCTITNGKTMMSNCLLVEGSECALLFDVLSTKPMTEEFIRQCRAFTDKPIRYLVISHPHGDHFLGANAVKDAIVIAQEGVKAAFDLDLQDPPYQRLQKRLPHMDFTDATHPYPDIYITDSCRIDLGGRMVEIRSVGKCHTASDVVMLIPDLHFMAMGDVLFNHVAPPTVSGDIDHWIEILDELQAGPAERFLPGHGPVSDKQDLAVMRGYLDGIRKQAEQVAAGTLTMCDEVPSPMEQWLIDHGWRETTRAIFSTEQYAAKLAGKGYKADMSRVFAMEAKRG